MVDGTIECAIQSYAVSANLVIGEDGDTSAGGRDVPPAQAAVLERVLVQAVLLVEEKHGMDAFFGAFLYVARDGEEEAVGGAAGQRGRARRRAGGRSRDPERRFRQRTVDATSGFCGLASALALECS